MRKHLLAVFLLFTFLLTHTALAQVQQPIIQLPNVDIASTIGTLLLNYIGIIFILVFVIILLFIGGVIHLPSGGGSILAMISFLILLALAFIFPQFILFPDYVREVPASFKIWEFPEAAKDALQLIGLPREWGYVPAIIYLFILPFAAIYTLFWAFLTTLGIFQQPHINRVLSVIVTFMTIPVGWFTKMVWALFAFMGGWSVAVFAIMFIFGIFFRGAGIVRREFGTFTTYSKYKKEADRFDAYAEKKIGELMNKGVDAKLIHGLREYADGLTRDIREGGANYDASKKQFEKAMKQG